MKDVAQRGDAVMACRGECVSPGRATRGNEATQSVALLPHSAGKITLARPSAAIQNCTVLQIIRGPRGPQGTAESDILWIRCAFRIAILPTENFIPLPELRVP